ncbi:Thyroxine-binding globulin [Microtus ochrogaster]|uniref:Thyroxine-binding globulin n=1 Tax=Microtus ochrogaster TaxID=79684 RepID=A0A8J6GIY5_MICOH|nr:Thyroxine-binding globulin [Microtus ochrogaster]
MRDAFAESDNFAGIMRDNGLKLSCAFHKALLHIGEQRTKEVAAPEAVSLEQPEVASLHPIIQFDRTSFLMVLEKRSRSILFLGKVINSANE